jgi:hypothetical protein
MLQAPSIASTLGGGVAIKTLGTDGWIGKKVTAPARWAAERTGKAVGDKAGKAFEAFKNRKKNSIENKD